MNALSILFKENRRKRFHLSLSPLLYFSASLSVSIYQSVCPSVCLSVCPAASLQGTIICKFLSISLSIFQCVFPLVTFSMRPSIFLSFVQSDNHSITQFANFLRSAILSDLVFFCSMDNDFPFYRDRFLRISAGKR